MAYSDLADSIATHMAARLVPWKDENEMREAVHETVRLIFNDARHDTLKLFGLDRVLS